ncbi:Fe-S cluster assembly protein NifU [Vibrio sp. 10N.286.49.B3]|uniref:Fe-S cluster assembly protein NifU n=1 Tax=Vibrio sp. 10N.286.49.B3 TaxID=1880855 RepID=UPI000C84E957|nr:Fe-S cluster assembly protein NifU [Vibrio sp. 10N.286.49.B3]PMH44848.1 Fe-S cluster assembly protein NifU [Vibrio sp. 10N.286.49.B3]
MWNYSDKVKEHFFQPRNAKMLDNASAKGDVGSLSCGDALSLSLNIDEETDVIVDAGFQTFGCGSAIASSSALTEIIIGKTVEQALKVTNNDIAEYLDGLPPEKMHCSVMGMEALHAAIADYRGEAVDDDHEEGELICKCFAIDDLMIKRVVAANNLTSLEEVINYTKAGGACSSCHEKIEWVLEDCLATPLKEVASTAIAATMDDAVQDKRRVIIEGVLDEVRPGIHADGGEITLVDIEDDMVFIHLSGNCSGCGLSGLTLASVETKISQALGEDIIVFPVQADSLKKEASYA